MDQEDPLEKGMATHSSILRTSLVAQMVEKKKKKSACSAEFHGQRSLVGYSPWAHKRIGHELATQQQQQNNNFINALKT